MLNPCRCTPSALQFDVRILPSPFRVTVLYNVITPSIRSLGNVCRIKHSVEVGSSALRVCLLWSRCRVIKSVILCVLTQPSNEKHAMEPDYIAVETYSGSNFAFHFSTLIAYPTDRVSRKMAKQTALAAVCSQYAWRGQHKFAVIFSRRGCCSPVTLLH